MPGVNVSGEVLSGKKNTGTDRRQDHSSRTGKRIDTGLTAGGGEFPRPCEIRREEGWTEDE